MSGKRKLSEADRIENRLRSKREWARREMKENPERFRNNARKHRESNRKKINLRNSQYYKSKGKARQYGLSPDQVQEILTKQNNQCAICGLVFNEMYVFDHDHTTGLFRGFLCKMCNSGLGFFRDNKEVISRAADYLGGSHR